MYELDGKSCEWIARQSGQPVDVVRRYLRMAYREPTDVEPWDAERHGQYMQQRREQREQRDKARQDSYITGSSPTA